MAEIEKTELLSMEEIEKIEIPDCWHVYTMLLEEAKAATLETKKQNFKVAAGMVLECWYRAHDLKRQLLRCTNKIEEAERKSK